MEQTPALVDVSGSVLDPAATDARESRTASPRDRERAANRLPSLRLVCCFVFVVMLLFVLYTVSRANNGHFVYALDDPYIHLALSEQIAHGHYGLNPTEYSSPASSILWPFLLAIFAGHAIHLYIPLLICAAAGLLTVYLLAGFVEQSSPGSATTKDWWMRLSVVVLLTFAGNLVSLPFVGLEHELQVLLAVASAIGLCRAWDGKPLPAWSLAAAALGPLVRYESLLITFAVVAVLAATRQVRRAVIVFAAGTLPVIAFSVFLRHLGLRALPSSVLVKMGHQTVHTSIIGKLYELFRMMYHALLDDPTRWPVAVLGLLLFALALRQQQWNRRAILLASALVALVHLLVGGFGWFHRYEVYAAVFLTVMFLRAMWTLEPAARASLLLALFYLASPYLAATLDTSAATHEIYCQQFQMQRFLDGYYRKSVAVNDIGMVSYRRPPGVYVLDLWGLAWYDAAVANRTPEWLQTNVGARGIGLVMLYPDRFDAPAAWTHIGELCIPTPLLVAGGSCVAFYGTTPAAAAEIEPELRQFVPTLPEGATFTFGATSPQ